MKGKECKMYEKHLTTRPLKGLFFFSAGVEQDEEASLPQKVRSLYGIFEYSIFPSKQLD